MKCNDAAVRVGLNHTELARIFLAYRNGGDAGAGPLFHVEFDHLPNVHTVDMVSSENGHNVRIRLLDQVHVLINRIRSAAVPIFLRRAHLSGNRNDEVVLAATRDFPALTQMLQKRLALELNQDVNGKNT